MAAEFIEDVRKLKESIEVYYRVLIASYSFWGLYFRGERPHPATGRFIERPEPERSKKYFDIVEILRKEREEKTKRWFERLERIKSESGLLKFCRDELKDLEGLFGKIYADFPEKETFILRLDEYIGKEREIIAKLEEVIKRWVRKIFVMGTYDPNKRNLEVHFYAPVNTDWDVDEVDDSAKDVMKYFLRISDYDIKVWDERTFGSEIEKKRAKRYKRSECPRDYKLVIHDYDYNVVRAISEFEWDLDWIEDLDGLKAMIKDNLRVFRGRRRRKVR